MRDRELDRRAAIARRRLATLPRPLLQTCTQAAAEELAGRPHWAERHRRRRLAGRGVRLDRDLDKEVLKAAKQAQQDRLDPRARLEAAVPGVVAHELRLDEVLRTVIDEHKCSAGGNESHSPCRSS
jgi:hypothetical protein